MSISLGYRQPILANVGVVIVVIIVWWLDLQLPVPITRTAGSLNPPHGEVS